MSSFLKGIFNDALRSYMIKHGMVGRLMNWKNLKRSSIGIIEISQHLPGGTEENHEKRQSTYYVSRPIFEPITFRI
jgi:hypothetical protein